MPKLSQIALRLGAAAAVLVPALCARPVGLAGTLATGFLHARPHDGVAALPWLTRIVCSPAGDMRWLLLAVSFASVACLVVVFRGQRSVEARLSWVLVITLMSLGISLCAIAATFLGYLLPTMIVIEKS